MRDCEVGPDSPASVTPTPMIEMLLFGDVCNERQGYMSLNVLMMREGPILE